MSSRRRSQFLDDEELLGGIVGSQAEHHTAPTR